MLSKSSAPKATYFLSILIIGSATYFPKVANTSDSRPLQVFILAGQSNMQGQGVVDLNHEQYYNSGKGTLEQIMRDPAKAPLYKHLKDSDGKWIERDDVWIWYKTEKAGLKKGGLSIGYTGYSGKHHIGPELQIGHLLGDHIDTQVLLIKTAWGGKSLHKDFRPPSAEGKVGPYYTRMLSEVQQALSNLSEDFPSYQDQGYQIAGFIWLQGWNDMFDDQARKSYKQNMVHFINDVRQDLKCPELPFVIGELGNGGEKAGDSMLAIRRAQRSAAALPKFNGSVRFVKTTQCARPRDSSPNVGHGHHWFGNAESYFLIGDALGRAMIELRDKTNKTK